MIIDIHSHILANVDDGSTDLDMSIAMAKLYIKNGFRKVIATPHYIQGSMDNLLDNNKIALKKLNDRISKEGLDLEVFLGSEIYVTMNTVDHIFTKKASTLNNSRYVLLELPMEDIPMHMEKLLYDLKLKGYIPIIAHPERNTKIIKNPNILYDYIAKGTLAQMNLPSLEGRYGKQVRNTANILLENNLIHFIGTDAHTSKVRSPDVSKALDILKEKVSQKQFENLTYKNAEFLLKDKIIQIEEPIIYKEKNRIFRFFKYN